MKNSGLVFFGRRVLIQLPDSYKEIVYRCEEIINEVEENHINYPEEEEWLMGFTDSVLHSRTNTVYLNKLIISLEKEIVF